MPILEAVRRGVVQNSFIVSDIQARGRLSDHNRIHGFRFEERTSTLERLYRNLTLCRV
jgi:hypothetical protein